MKKIYLSPAVRSTRLALKANLMEPSINGNTNDGNNPISGGEDDTGGNGDPDAKRRGGIDGWGDLW